MRTHEHKHIQSSLSLSQTNTNTSRSASFSPPTRSRKHPDSGGCLWYRADTGPWKMHVPFACFIRNTHRDSIPISAEKPHRNINYAGNLGGSVGRNAAEGEYGIQSVILMRGSVSLWSSGGANITCTDYKIHVGLNVIEMLLSARQRNHDRTGESTWRRRNK